MALKANLNQKELLSIGLCSSISEVLSLMHREGCIEHLESIPILPPFGRSWAWSES